MVWSIWLARNDLVFNQKEFVFETIWDLQLMRVMWWTKAWWKDCPYSSTDFSLNFVNIKTMGKVRKVRQCVWNPPPVNTLKFNVDGSARGAPGISGAGGILKNAAGSILGRFSKSLGGSLGSSG